MMSSMLRRLPRGGHTRALHGRPPPMQGEAEKAQAAGTAAGRHHSPSCGHNAVIVGLVITRGTHRVSPWTGMRRWVCSVAEKRR